MFKRKLILQHKMGKLDHSDGGLEFCETCGGCGSSLTTNCQGKTLTNAQENLVSNGKLDFVGTKWVYVREAK